ncbi:MarR family winged helix-turn-helix transcriptional regulator [Ancylobacter oerskovii]|uniref:MarR family winged helix-turn-helix transcriptional regulator n=1 Tax=Ancylobacter oerskovii TaxID=459519 RepID=A0ABW4Z268_9HYPH|nr:MarR family transcriptional regulator [Ancylobacter oerskovii]MBS7544812.1 MarR family transcriptional regulator [Ancylobacter oerskovii]
MTDRPHAADDSPELEDRDYVALASFRHALRHFLAFSEEAARAVGMTPQQHQAILAIRGLSPREGMTINDFAERMLLKQHTAVELVDRLEAAGLVRRARDAGDRRRALLTLTDRAGELLEALSRAHLAQIGRDAPQLIEILQRMSRKDGPARS